MIPPWGEGSGGHNALFHLKIAPTGATETVFKVFWDFRKFLMACRVSCLLFLKDIMILHSAAFNLSIKEYYYNNLSSHSSLAKMSYLSEISCSRNRTKTSLCSSWNKFQTCLVVFYTLIPQLSKTPCKNDKQQT